MKKFIIKNNEVYEVSTKDAMMTKEMIVSDNIEQAEKVISVANDLTRYANKVISEKDYNKSKQAAKELYDRLGKEIKALEYIMKWLSK